VVALEIRALPVTPDNRRGEVLEDRAVLFLNTVMVLDSHARFLEDRAVEVAAAMVRGVIPVLPVIPAILLRR